MNQITRCPACETMFRVVPDQLRISEGWVRCGQCGEIFDAPLHLLADNTDDMSPAPGGEATATLASVATPMVQSAAIASPGAAPAGPRAADPEVPRNDAPRDANPALMVGPGDPIWSDLAATGQQPLDRATDLPSVERPTARSDFTRTALEFERDAPNPSFLRETGNVSVPSRPMVRLVLGLLLLLLLVTLAVQILRHERDQIASIEPATRPLLLALCNWFPCEISPIRQIDSIVIDSSSFSRDHGEIYRLGFSLKNNAATDIAMPSLELTLTDSQDQPLFRRVIRPAEFGTGSMLLGAASEWGNSLTLSVRAASALDRVAGYRLLAFYP